MREVFSMLCPFALLLCVFVVTIYGQVAPGTVLLADDFTRDIGLAPTLWEINTPVVRKLAEVEILGSRQLRK